MRERPPGRTDHWSATAARSIRTAPGNCHLVVIAECGATSAARQIDEAVPDQTDYLVDGIGAHLQRIGIRQERGHRSFRPVSSEAGRCRNYLETSRGKGGLRARHVPSLGDQQDLAYVLWTQYP